MSKKPQRHTIKVAFLVNKANAFMSGSAESARLERLHVADFVGCILRDTGNPAGFDYLPGNDSSRIVFHYA